MNNVSPEKVIENLKDHILVDGFHVVVDMEKSKDSWVVDAVTGDKYLDCYSQFASQALGWNHDKLKEMFNEDNIQNVHDTVMHKLANSDMYSTVYCDFVNAFSKITPDFEHYFFVDGGALAVENAIKASFDWKAQSMGFTEDDVRTKDLDVVHLREAFHGRTGYTLSLTNTGAMKTKWFPQFDWSRIVNPKTQRKDIEIYERKALAQVETAMQNKIVAAIVIEPIQGEGGDNYFRNSFFKGLRELADKYEAMLIFDEVQTGLGLTGRMWAYEHFGVKPDMMCFGKKTQVCGFCSNGRIDSVPKNVFRQSGRINSTWGGNTLDMLRATHIIDIVEKDNLVANSRSVGAYLITLLTGVDEIFNIRGKGLMIAFDFETEVRRDQVVAKLQKTMLPLKCGEKSIRLRPHLTFTREDAEQLVEFLKEALKD